MDTGLTVLALIGMTISNEWRGCLLGCGAARGSVDGLVASGRAGPVGVASAEAVLLVAIRSSAFVSPCRAVGSKGGPGRDGKSVRMSTSVEAVDTELIGAEDATGPSESRSICLSGEEVAGT